MTGQNISLGTCNGGYDIGMNFIINEDFMGMDDGVDLDMDDIGDTQRIADIADTYREDVQILPTQGRLKLRNEPWYIEFSALLTQAQGCRWFEVFISSSSQKYIGHLTIKCNRI
jgi:hypothetical protein